MGYPATVKGAGFMHTHDPASDLHTDLHTDLRPGLLMDHPKVTIGGLSLAYYTHENKGVDFRFIFEYTRGPFGNSVEGKRKGMRP